MELLVAICAYREAENLKVLIPAIRDQINRIGCTYDILIVDGQKSLDHTAQVCEELGVRYQNQFEPSYGGAIRTVFQLADSEKLLIMDADGSHSPSEIPAMYEAMQDGVDLVVCSRNIPGGVSEDKASSQTMSKILQTFYRVATGMKVTDFSTSFRLYRTEQVKKLLLSGEHFDILEEILMKLKLQKKDLVIAETPQHMLQRMYGSSNRSLLKFIASLARMLVKLVSLRLIARKSYQPQRDEARAVRLMNALLYTGIYIVSFALGYAAFAACRAITGSFLASLIVACAIGLALSYYGNISMNFHASNKRGLQAVLYTLITLIGTAAILLTMLKTNIGIVLATILASLALQILAHRNLTFSEKLSD